MIHKQSIPKISILLITYNQEDVISRAIDSILIQKEYVYEIIIGEDCSTDKTWDIISLYAQKYPEIIKPIKNEHNLGIFGNIENLYDKHNGDIVFFLSGDDAFCDGLFLKTIQKIQEENIDYINELFTIYFDAKIIYPDGNSMLLSNQIIESGFDPISLKIRNLIHNRAAAISSNIIKKQTAVDKKIGIGADFLMDIQLQQITLKSYYVAFVGNVYFAGIGVSVKTDAIKYYNTYCAAHREFEKSNVLNSKDKSYLRFIELKAYYSVSPSIYTLLKLIKSYLFSIDLKYGIKGLQIDKCFFYVKRKVRIKL